MNARDRSFRRPSEPGAAPSRLRPLITGMAVIAMVLVACGKPAMQSKHLPPQLDAATDADETKVAFMAHALNALLVPLLDDDVPSRWADPWPAMACDAASVTVDGVELVPREPVPAVPFTIRWQMKNCAPLGADMMLSGAVEMLVFHDGDSYSAHVRPDNLRITTLRESITLTHAFSARTPLN